jgi:mycothiol synthase
MSTPRLSRNASIEDIDAITTMLDAATQTHVGRRTSQAETEDRLRTPGCVLETDSLLVTDGQDVVGLALVWRAPPSDVRGFARVHPQHRGEGVGTTLAKFMADRGRLIASELRAPVVRFSTTAWAADSTAAPVLRSAGLVEVRHFIRMARSLDGDLPAPVWPEEVRVRSFAPGQDEDALFTAYRSAFAAHWGQENHDEQAWWWDGRDSPDSGYDPALWFIADAGGEIAGFVIGRQRERQHGREGYVSFVGVRPPWRGRRLGHALMSHELRVFASRGLPTGALDVDVDNVTSALDLYRSVGMTSEPNFTAWGTDLPGRSATDAGSGD